MTWPLPSAPVPALSLDQGVLAWAAWLEGNQVARAPLPPLPALYRLKQPFSRMVGKQPVWTAHVFDWVLPAERYAADVTLERLLRMDAPLRAIDVRRLLDTPRVNEHLLRSFYALFLQSLDCAVDHHGWVYTNHGRAHLGQILGALDESGQRRVARVLRFLHLSGWRGFSYTGYRDPQDFSYAHGLKDVLMDAWSRGGTGRPYPAIWRNAVQDPAPTGSRDVLSLCMRRIKVLGETLYRR